MKEIRFILIVITLGIFLSACDKEQPTPDLPPSASFVMEIDNMWNNSPAPDAFPTGVPQSNFVFAAANVYWWNTVLTIQLAIPAATFLESFKHDPVWDKTEGAWVWSYSVDLQNVTYSASLHGKTEANEVKWSMYISRSDSYTDFLWFTGVSNTTNTSVSWTINKSPDSNIKMDEDPIPFVGIEWTSNGESTAEIIYTSIEPGSANEGSYIMYGILDDPDLDAYYDIFTVWENEIVNIKWNTTSHNGRVLSVRDFKDPYWHCWDEVFQNIACE